MKTKKDIYEYINNICEIPEFLIKYLKLRIITRLKKIGYFCGMDYASKNIYDFEYKITRYDHSLSTALIVWKLTNDKKQTIIALLHDISTPCFSHVIDYMNKDYITQESTEEKTETILKNSLPLKKLLKLDNLTIEDILNFKKYSIIDNKRPKLCADRIDGIILNNLAWSKKLKIEEVKNIIEDLIIFKNEDDEFEIGFKSEKLAKRIYELNNIIDELCHSKEDNYMMELLANITRYLINNNIIQYDELYKLTEEKLFYIIDSIKSKELKEMVKLFRNIKLEEITTTKIPTIKKRIINPLINNKRLLKSEKL